MDVMGDGATTARDRMALREWEGVMRLTKGQEREELEAERVRLTHLLAYERRLRRDELKALNRELRKQAITAGMLRHDVARAKLEAAEAWKSRREVLAAVGLDVHGKPLAKTTPPPPEQGTNGAYDWAEMQRAQLGHLAQR